MESALKLLTDCTIGQITHNPALDKTKLRSHSNPQTIFISSLSQMPTTASSVLESYEKHHFGFETVPVDAEHDYVLLDEGAVRTMWREYFLSDSPESKELFNDIGEWYGGPREELALDISFEIAAMQSTLRVLEWWQLHGCEDSNWAEEDTPDNPCVTLDKRWLSHWFVSLMEKICRSMRVAYKVIT
jgi:hypothetical protein